MSGRVEGVRNWEVDQEGLMVGFERGREEASKVVYYGCYFGPCRDVLSIIGGRFWWWLTQTNIERKLSRGLMMIPLVL